MKPRARCTLAEWAQTTYRLSQRRAARLIPVRLNTWRYQRRRDSQEALRQRLRELARVRVRFGYRRLTVLLRREGWPVNAKRIYRLYREEGLEVRTKRRKRLASTGRVPLPPAAPARRPVPGSWLLVPGNRQARVGPPRRAEGSRIEPLRRP